jgi:hypothetical protein
LCDWATIDGRCSARGVARTIPETNFTEQPMLRVTTLRQVRFRWRAAKLPHTTAQTRAKVLYFNQVQAQTTNQQWLLKCGSTHI